MMLWLDKRLRWLRINQENNVNLLIHVQPPGNPSPSSKSARNVDFTHRKTTAVENGSILKNARYVKMKPVAANSHSGRLNESEKSPTPVSLLIPPQNPILIPFPSAQSYPPSLDPRITDRKWQTQHLLW